MPRVNFTIDNISPLIQYGPGWMDGSPTNDTLWSRYFNQTFTVANINGLSTSFTFNGTGVWIFGAKRGNHGNYSVALDGDMTVYDGNAPDPGEFQVPLFGASNLTNQWHSTALKNIVVGPRLAFVDVDFLTWETQIGLDSENVTETVLKDTTSSFAYSPKSDWNLNPPDLGDFAQGTGHFTTAESASAILTFQGDAVSLFGAVGPQMGPYNVQLDNGPLFSYNAFKHATAGQQMLYHANSLGAGKHVLRVTNMHSGQGLGIDFAKTYHTPSIDALSVAVAAHPPPKRGLTFAAIGGISAVITFFVLAVIIFTILYMRRRREGTQEIIATRESTPQPTPSIRVFSVDPYPFQQWPPTEPDPFSKRSHEDLSIQSQSALDTRSGTSSWSREGTPYLLTPTQPNASFTFSSQDSHSQPPGELRTARRDIHSGEPPPDYHQITQVPHSIRNKPGRL